MIKAFGILMSQGLLERLEAQPSLQDSRGMMEALRCIHAVTEMAVHPQHKTSYRPPRREGQGPNKAFECCHAENKELVSILKRATSMSATISFGVGENIDVRLNFSGDGIREFTRVHAIFSIETGIGGICALTL